MHYYDKTNYGLESEYIYLKEKLLKSNEDLFENPLILNEPAV